MKLAAHGLVALVVGASMGTAGCGSDPASPEPAVADPAELVVAYAKGGAPDVPWADTVTYTVGGEEVARFDAASADLRETWDGCPGDLAEYEGRDCPVSPLMTIASAVRHGEGVVHEASAPTTVGCNRYRLDVGRTSTVWIRPDAEHRDCFSDFAVALSFDDATRVSSVDLTLSGP